MRVYIAGPYTIGDVCANVANAIDAAHAVMDAKHSPFTPHLSHFLHLHRQRPYEDWMALDFEWLKSCDVMVRLPGESSGADREVARARELGITVCEGMASLLDTLT